MPENKPQWTPGPWGNALPWAVTQSGRVILTTAVDIPTTGEAEAIANVTLAAAAPDLWTALERLVQIDAKQQPRNFTDHEFAMAQARAALLKANPQRTQEREDDTSEMCRICARVCGERVNGICEIYRDKAEGKV